MRVPRCVAAASVLIMLVSDSAGKPQQVPGLSLDNDCFLIQLEGNSVSGCPGKCESCVKIDNCCDPPVLSEDPSFLDLIIKKQTPCSALEICCKTKCNTSSDPSTPTPPTPTPPTPTPPTPPTPPTEERCGIRNTDEDRVAGAVDDTKFGEFPWMVAVLTQGNNEYVGGGSLVNRKVVLTAAHKLDGKSNFLARLGDWDISEKTAQEHVDHQSINVKKVVVHPRNDPKKLINNVALLILENDAVLGSTVMPICLPAPGEVFDGSQCIVTGWGKTALGTDSFQKELKKVLVPAVNHNACQSMLRKTKLGSNFKLDDSFNCAGGEGSDSCEGDGGSPLICPKPNKHNEYVQMGVTAWGIGCGIVGNPGVYGSVPKTVDWINQIINEEGGA